MAETRNRIGEDLHLRSKLLRVPKIVLITEGKKIVVGPTCVERCPKAASEICVDANTGVVFEKMYGLAGEASDRIANVLTLRAVRREEDLDVLVRLRKERSKLTRQKLKVGPIKAEDDKDTAIEFAAQEP